MQSFGSSGNIKAVFFDWSGTLADDLGPVIEATNAVLEHHGVASLDREGFRTKFRLPYTEFYEEMIPGASLEDLESIFRQHHAQSEEKCFLLPGAMDLLRWCRQQNFLIYLCSSVHEDGWIAQAEELSVREFFHEAHTGVRDKVADFGSFLEQHQLQPQQCVFLGDMIHDVEAAKAHGVTSIALTHGYDSREKLESAAADFLCEDLMEAKGVIMALDKRDGVAAKNAAKIEICGLKMDVFLGVYAEEIAELQQVELDLVLLPEVDILASKEEIEATIDYALVAEKLVAEAGARPRKLLETLVSDLADCVLAQFPVRQVQLRLKKFILPNTKHVALELQRWR